jgi:CRISPR system Cascade subunit CasB
MFRFLKDSSTREKLLEWWAWLDKNRGDRARLRRVESGSDGVFTEAFRHLLVKAPELELQLPKRWSENQKLSALAMVAAILAHVKKDLTVGSFATQLATSKNGDKSRMSTLRFQQLQKSHDPEEFYRRMLRAVRLLEGNVNISSLADNILHWLDEYYWGVDRNPQKRLLFCWANDYYRTSN